MSTPARTEVFASARQAAVASAEAFATAARAAVAQRGRFSVALGGGTAPREAYALLEEEPYRSRIPWNAVHLFWGDERCVPPGHPRSNFGMTHAAFISRVPIPSTNVHRMRGEWEPARAAEAYAAELYDFFGPGTPAFDVVHLGVGPDAHTCSLFPFDTDALAERERTVIPTLFRPLAEWRITITFPVVNAASRVEMLALGAAKAPVARTVLAGPLDPFHYPAQFVRPRGEYVWLMDREAAAELAPRREMERPTTAA